MEKTFKNICKKDIGEILEMINDYLPDLEKWQKIDDDNQYYDIYNRYAHISVIIQDKNDTSFKLDRIDSFIVYLNVNDLVKLNVSYIATDKNLNKFSNDKVSFENIYKDHKFKIYHVRYS